jgi:antitoxin (DNA-binding transcriptional repressor) of toxin-antitoxin stability system
MKRVMVSQLLKNAKKYFDSVEKGEIFEVFRQGKPIAILSPVTGKTRWSNQRPFEPIKIPGVSGSKLIIEERNRSRF